MLNKYIFCFNFKLHWFKPVLMLLFIHLFSVLFVILIGMYLYLFLSYFPLHRIDLVIPFKLKILFVFILFIEVFISP